MMPDVAQLEAAFGRHGVGNDSRVVLYSIGTAMWATRFWWMLQIARLRQCRGARRRPRQVEGGGPRDRERTREGLSACDASPRIRAPAILSTAATCCRASTTATPSWSTRSDRNSTRVWSQAATAGPAAFPAACNVSAATLVDPATKAFLPLAEAETEIRGTGLFQGQARDRLLRRRHLGDRSTSSCCIGSATASSRSMTARWANGLSMNAADRGGLVFSLSPFLRGECRRPTAAVLPLFEERRCEASAMGDGLVQRKP